MPRNDFEHLNPKDADPYLSGHADAVMGRPCDSPWKDDFVKQNAYVKGYLYGKHGKR